MSEWIGVDERMPDKRGLWLVYDGRRVSVGRFNSDDGWFMDRMPLRNITHWKPLPDPPNEDG